MLDPELPTSIKPSCKIEDKDAIFFFNFRADRARELTQAFLCDDFDGFYRKKRPKLFSFCSMTRYAKTLNTSIVFPPLSLKNTLGEILSAAGLRQLRLAETEKYAHVTFFFNGGSEQTFPGETRKMIQSPKVKTYDLKPEMSARELTKTLVTAIQEKAYDVIICNYANADMVGHTGNMKATIQAIECLDSCLSAVGEAIKAAHGQLIITADHGNAESMFDDATQQPQTSHTSEPVPFLYIGDKALKFRQSTGDLSSVAPTILELLKLEKPAEMTGNSLILSSTMAQS